jgi:hypothetical protein
MSEDRSWFWNEGYRDGLRGQRWILPDEARHQSERTDYAAGYDAGSEDREPDEDGTMRRGMRGFTGGRPCS